MKHLQPQTLQIISAILACGNRRFSQMGIWKFCSQRRSISIGQVNNVINTLQQLGFVERLWKNSMSQALNEAGAISNDNLDFNMGRAAYRVIDPVDLLIYISKFRLMSELRLFTFSVNATEETVKRELVKRGVIFCLGTAQEYYAAYYRPNEISFYSINPEKLKTFFKTAKTGKSRLSCYKVDYMRTTPKNNDLLDSLFANQSGNVKITSKVQTVIDMFCDGKGAYTKPLLRELWGVEI